MIGRKIDAQDLREIGVFKHYRLVRMWICRTYNISNSDLELLIYLDCIGKFRRHDYQNGIFAYSWDKRRWLRLMEGDWIKLWRMHNRTTQKYNIYVTTRRASQIISRMYRILLGDEDFPMSLKRNKFLTSDRYSDKQVIAAMHKVNIDKSR